MEMLNEKAIEIIATEVPAHDGEVRAALELAMEALKVYKSLLLVPDGNTKFNLHKPDYDVHIYCDTEETSQKVIEFLDKYGKNVQNNE